MSRKELNKRKRILNHRNQAVKIHRAGERKKHTCGQCKRFDKCRITKDVEAWNYVPECTDGRWN